MPLTLAELAGAPELSSTPWRSGRLSATGIRLRRTERGVEGECLPEPDVLDRALRFVWQPELLRAGWLMLHACSVVLADGAHVFAAASGVGKSTLLARLVQAGAAPLGDEVAVVGHGMCRVFPYQPVAGDAEAVAPLAALHLLGRGEPSTRRMSKAGAASVLLGHAMVYEEGAGPAREALEVLSGLLANAPAYETLVPDDDRAASHLVALAAGRRP